MTEPLERPKALDIASFGIYVHLPFCLKKCNYCDFLSFLLPNQDGVADYVLGLKKEMELAAPELAGLSAASLYLGGGTPSLLSSGNLKTLLLAAQKHFSLASEAEITVEANPGTLSPIKLREIRDIGINRLSFGVQSMNDRLLLAMGRGHTAEEARTCYYLAREAGFENINIDLIYGLPEQTKAMWQDTLVKAAALKPEHISAYGLSLEEGTPWGNLYSQDQLSLPGEDDWAGMHDITGKILSTAGLEQYEISNYARPGCESVHNLGYWQRRPYIGLGLGAASLLNETRYRNYSSLEKYFQVLAGNKLPREDVAGVSIEEAMSETMFLGLRTVQGVSIGDFVAKYHRLPEEVFPPVIPLTEAGVLFVEEGRLKLDSHYYAVSNEVFARFV